VEEQRVEVATLGKGLEVCAGFRGVGVVELDGYYALLIVRALAR